MKEWANIRKKVQFMESALFLLKGYKISDIGNFFSNGEHPQNRPAE